jgi:hypothetical protein
MKGSGTREMLGHGGHYVIGGAGTWRVLGHWLGQWGNGVARSSFKTHLHEEEKSNESICSPIFQNLLLDSHLVQEKVSKLL